MPRGDKSSYTDKQKRQAPAIALLMSKSELECQQLSNIPSFRTCSPSNRSVADVVIRLALAVNSARSTR